MAAQDITALLHRWRDGDAGVADELFPHVYADLRALAGQMMRHERSDHTLQATALVHEAYLRLVGRQRPDLQNRAHFFAVAAQAMRRILVDYARRLRFAKRSGVRVDLSLDGTAVLSPSTARDLVALDDALNAMDHFDPRMRRVVELRFFGGLSVEETALVLEVSTPTVKRDWRAAKAWLHGTLGGSDG